MTPPIHMPFCMDAAILSRTLSPVTSGSNWANESSVLSVRRPIEVVVLNCCVTETHETPLVSKASASVRPPSAIIATMFLCDRFRRTGNRADGMEHLEYCRPSFLRARRCRLRQIGRSRQEQAHRPATRQRRLARPQETRRPDGIRDVFQPPHSPKLQPAEHMWAFVDEALALRQSKASTRP